MFIRLIGEWEGKKNAKEREKKNVAAPLVQTQRALLYGTDKTFLWFMVEIFCTPPSYLKVHTCEQHNYQCTFRSYLNIIIRSYVMYIT